MIELKDVAKCYSVGDQPVEVLHNVNLRISEGAYIAIVGPSGSGKSTLLNIVGLMEVPSSGTVLWFGESTSDASDRIRSRFRSRHVGFIFQSFNLLPRMTVLENVRLPGLYAGVDNSRLEERALEVLGSLGMSHRLRHLPSQLSGGERQRVAIARSLINSPKLIVADEPTGNLDNRSAGDVVNTFRRVNALGVAVLLVTHNVAIAREGREEYLIENGKLERTR